MQYKTSNQYHLACGKYFEVTHKMPLMSSVTHPNQYFDESQKLLSGSQSETHTSKTIVKSSNSGTY